VCLPLLIIRRTLGASPCSTEFARGFFQYATTLHVPATGRSVGFVLDRDVPCNFTSLRFSAPRHMRMRRVSEARGVLLVVVVLQVQALVPVAHQFHLLAGSTSHEYRHRKR